MEQFGNRIPQLSFEVFRPIVESDTTEGMVRAVTLIPGTGEFVYATEAICAAPVVIPPPRMCTPPTLCLTEARGVLADIGHHPDSLVLLACRAICAHSPDRNERTDALGMMHLLSARPPETVNTAPKGGVA